ncbi:hypothetical protein [Nocardia sp. NBC_01009]|uniref:hypothetical protein n=1 Tax=Nocardia sp. NBC_01009 TaxID=2975996 RepID=UPI003869E647|nr:hypothetical protein OHA42_14490 [Nocardia sp. NBC_01009]
MNHNKKSADRYTALERRHRAQIVGGLRDQGMSYRQIGQRLGISLAQVEACLGEAARLREQGLTKQEVADEIGIPYGSLGRVLVVHGSRGLSFQQDAALAALVDMHGMQVDVLAEFLSFNSLSSAYDLADALLKRRMVHPLLSVQRGRAWVYPKREVAERYLGWRPKDWKPPLMFANHYRAVAQARVMLVGSAPQLWVSERVLRRRAEVAAFESKSGHIVFSDGRSPHKGRPHVHDGRFLGEVEGQHGWWALEIELSAKDRVHMDTALQGAIRAARDSEDEAVLGLLYLCRSPRVMNTVDAAYKRLPAELAAVKLLFAIGDFDEEWGKFLTRRNQGRRARKTSRPNLLLTQEAS